MSTYESEFALGDKVFADGCDDLIMIVTAIQWRSTHALIECSWVSGDARTAWFEPWRLARSDKQ